MRLRPKMLLDRLSPESTQSLERAATLAAQAGHEEITLEHALLGFVETAQVIDFLRAVGVPAAKLSSEMSQHVSALRGGSAANPVFGRRLFPFLEDAWLSATVESGATHLSPVQLVAQFLRQPLRYSTVGRDFEVDESQIRAALDGTQRADAVEQSAADSLGEAKKFLIDLTEKAREGGIDPIFGRHREIRQVMDILMRRRKNNPMLVGEPGVGKTALAEGLALAIANEEVPDMLKDVRVLSLDLSALEAGASVRGEFERRLRAVIDAISAAPGEVVLFIDEAHRLVGAGGSEGTGDAANLLKPALARGDLRTIGATTWSEYKRYIEKDAALVRRFQPVKVEEPSAEVAVGMLRGICSLYEKAHGIHVTNEALVAAVHLSKRYLPERRLPDKAIDVLDTTLARIRVGQEAKPEALLGAEAELRALQQQATSMLRDQGECDAVRACQVEVKSAEQRAETLRALWTESRDEGERVTAIDCHAVAETLSAWTGVPLGSMEQDFGEKALGFETHVQGRIIGQNDALGAVGDALRIAHAGVRDPDAPVAVLLLSGPSGVGKTETARAVADYLYSGDRSLITINLSEFQERHTLSRLVGSPPGYVGYGEGGLLTEAVRQKPYSVVLLDECEKAHPDIMNAFYQLFDRGRLRDGEGRDVDFRNTVILLTSNLGSRTLDQLSAASPNATLQDQAEAIHQELESHFKPALLARMNVVPYAPLGPADLRRILELRLSALRTRVEQSHGTVLTFNDDVLESLAARCEQSTGGARRIEHTLQTALAPKLARELIRCRVAGEEVAAVRVGVDESGLSYTVEVEPDLAGVEAEDQFGERPTEPPPISPSAGDEPEEPPLCRDPISVESSEEASTWTG